MSGMIYAISFSKKNLFFLTASLGISLLALCGMISFGMYKKGWCGICCNLNQSQEDGQMNADVEQASMQDANSEEEDMPAIVEQRGHPDPQFPSLLNANVNSDIELFM